MEVLVQGGRTTISDRQAVRRLPKEQLPPLNDAQRAIAQKRGIGPDEYARAVMAEQRTTEKLAAKTARFGRVFEERLRSRAPQASIEQIALITVDGKFELVLKVAGRRISAVVNESVVNDLLEGGAAEADQRLNRIIELLLTGERVA